jgi:hypothetical protein
MLHDDRHVRFDDTGKIRVDGYRFWIPQIIKPNVPRPARRDHDAIRPARLTIGKINRDFDLSVVVGGVQDANGFMTGELGRRAMAVRRNVTFRNGPALCPDRFHSNEAISLPSQILPAWEIFRARRSGKIPPDRDRLDEYRRDQNPHRHRREFV